MTTSQKHRAEKGQEPSQLSAASHEALSVYTPRERQILELVGEGLTNHEIAERLFVTDSTVKFHVRQILRKSGAKNRFRLVTYACQFFPPNLK